MAIYNTQSGTFSGKVGGIVGSSWKGINYIKSYAKPKQPLSDAQRRQRKNFSILSTFANALCKNWLPSVFTNDNLLTFSNQFIKANKSIFSTSLEGWEINLNGSFSFSGTNKKNVEKTALSVSFEVEKFIDFDFSQVKKYFYAIYFSDSNMLFFSITSDFTKPIKINFERSFENEHFFSFEQIITESGVSKVQKSSVSIW